MANQAVLYHRRKRQRERSIFQRYAAQIANPVDLGTAQENTDFAIAYKVLAPIHFRLILSESRRASFMVTTNGGRVFSMMDRFQRDEPFNLGYLEPGVELTIQSDRRGHFTLDVLDPWNRPFPVATGEVIR